MARPHDRRLLKVNPVPCRISLFLLPAGRINPAEALPEARRDLGTTGADPPAAVNTTKRNNNNSNNNSSNSRRWNRNLKCLRSRITNFPRD